MVLAARWTADPAGSPARHGTIRSRPALTGAHLLSGVSRLLSGRIGQHLARLDEGLEPLQVVLHLVRRVGAEQRRDGVTHRTGDRVVRQLDMNLRTPVADGLEAQRSHVRDELAIRGPPGDLPTFDAPGLLRIEGNGHTGRPGDDPVRRTTVVRKAD